MEDNKIEERPVAWDTGIKKKQNLYTDEDLLRDKPKSESAEKRDEKRDRQREKKAKKAALSPQVAARNRARRRRALVYLIAVVAFAAIVFSSAMSLFNLQKEKREAQKELDAVHRKQEQLQAEYEAVDSDEYVEQAARSELHMIMPGETLYVVDKDDKATKPAVEATDGALRVK
jgi:cell division protein FtsL